MSEHATDPRTASMTVHDDESIVGFRHRLGGPVIVRAYDAGGAPVGYEGSFEIDANEVEVMVVPGTVALLVAEPAPAEGQ